MDELLIDPLVHQTINITGSGDPFASLAFRHFLEEFDGTKYPNLIFDFQTNGLLFTPIIWDRLKKIHNNVGEVSISIDAATSDTYEEIRRLGNWNVLLNNMKFICDLRKDKKLKFVKVNFVVQDRNFREIPAFAELFIKMGCDAIFYSLLVDWNTMKDFKNHEVHVESHPHFYEFLEIMANSILENNKVDLGNLTAFRALALSRI